MFAEIRSEYLRTDRPCPLALVVCTLGNSDFQVPINRPEGFNYHQLLWVESGEGTFTSGGQRRMLGPGEGLFCRAGTSHSYEKAGSAFSTRWVTFYGGDGMLDYFGVPDHFYFTADNGLVSSIDELDRICRGSSTIMSRSAAGYSAISNWLAGIFDSEPTPVTIVHQYLESHFGEPITLDNVAAQVNMNRYALCRYYRETQNTTVMEQLRRIRIEKAKQYLRHLSCTIEEVASMCGFESSSYFGKLFREDTGLSPREYRYANMR